MKRLVIFMAAISIWAPSLHAQQSAWDTLNIRYEIISQGFSDTEDVIKIRVPPYLSTAEVMEQIKLALQWPGDPPPRKLTRIYVFKDTDQVGDSSQTGAVYIPGKGYVWNLAGWKPIAFPLQDPSLLEKVIYNTLLDSIFAHGASTHNLEIKEKVARKFDITVSKLDSIYWKVKYWKSY